MMNQPMIDRCNSFDRRITDLLARGYVSPRDTFVIDNIDLETILFAVRFVGASQGVLPNPAMKKTVDLDAEKIASDLAKREI